MQTTQKTLDTAQVFALKDLVLVPDPAENQPKILHLATLINKEMVVFLKSGKTFPLASVTELMSKNDALVCLKGRDGKVITQNFATFCASDRIETREIYSLGAITPILRIRQSTLHAMKREVKDLNKTKTLELYELLNREERLVEIQKSGLEKESNAPSLQYFEY